ncbi:MAG: FAD-dependent monooxygenase [Pseudomonadota bacterium]
MTAPVVIVGGGIAGLALACGLGRANVASTVLEAASDPQPIGAGLQLGPNAMRALDTLGFASDDIPGLVAPETLQIRDRQGRTLLRKPLGETFAQRYGAPYRVSHRGDLWSALRARAEAMDAVTLIDGARIAEIIPAGPRIALEDGRIYAPTVLIGADGIRSQVAEALPGPVPLTDHGLEAWRTLVPVPSSEAADNSVTLTFAPKGGHAVRYPVSAGAAMNLVVITQGSGTDGHNWSMPGETRDLLARFGGNPPADLAPWFEMAPGWQRWPLRDRTPTKHWGNRANAPAGPATVIGDAAHPALPFLAQGGAMALEDAAALVTPLVEALSAKGDVSGALRQFEAARKLRTDRLVRASRGVGRTYHLPFPLSLARDASLRVAGAALTDRYDWLYRA